MTVFRVETSRGQEPGTFRVRGVSSVAGAASADVRLASEKLLGRRDELQRAVRRSSAVIQDDSVKDEQRVQEIGRQLFTALLGSVQLWGLYQASLAAAVTEGERLKVVLQINDPVLAGLPWETMYDESNGSYVSRRAYLIRQLDVAAAVAPLAVKPPLRILGVVSSPVDLRKLDVQREKTNLEEVLTPLAHDRKAEIVWPPSSTWKDLQHTLLVRQCQAVHYIGHGGFDEEKDKGVLALTDNDGHMHLVEAGELVDLLGQANPTPRLVVLNSCSGAASGADLFSGTAAALIRGGATAVVAMQYEISDRAAVAFSDGFYDAIANGRGVDAAILAGRAAIIGWRAGTLEWISPVLYLRGEDCRLFTMHQAPPKELAAADGDEARQPGNPESQTEPGSRPAPRVIRPETDPADQALADEIAAKNSYDAADKLAVLPSSQAAHILTLMNPKTAPLVLAKLSDAAAREILPFLEPDTLAAMLGSSDNTARLLQLADVRLAAATLTKMQESGRLSGGMVLRRMEPQPAAAIIDEMTRAELDKAHYFSSGAPPDPLDRLIDYVSIKRSLYLMDRISFGRAAKLLENMVKRDSERAEKLRGEMKRELAGGIFAEMDFDAARGWITRMDATSATRLLEAMPPKIAAIMRESIEKPDED